MRRNEIVERELNGFGNKSTNRKKQKQVSSQLTGETAYKEALAFHAQGDLSRAESAYNQAIKAGYVNESILSNLGVVYQNSGKPKQAIKLYKKALEINPNHSGSYVNLGSAYNDLGNFDQALDAILQSLKINPNNPIALLNLSNIYKNVGNYDKSLAAILKSLKLDPYNPNAFITLGSIFHITGELDKALDATLKSLKINPTNPSAFTNLGIIYKDLGKLDLALKTTLKALELNPNNPNAQLNLGSTYKDLGKLVLALNATLKALELNPNNPNALLSLGSIYKDLGKLDEARAYTLKYLKLHPNNSNAHINLGVIYKELGTLDQALYSTLKAVELDPNNYTAHMNLGGIYQDLGILDRAASSTLLSLNINKTNNTKAVNNMAQILQATKPDAKNNDSTGIISINKLLLKKKIPENLESGFNSTEVDRFFKESLFIAKELDKNIATELTQIFFRNGSTMSCIDYTNFFNIHNAIAERCHFCYKVQITVNHLDDLLKLYLIFKILRLDKNNLRKCMVELRSHATGLYKGLIYCASANEAMSVRNHLIHEIQCKAKLAAEIKIKRGCTEFTNAYPEYGNIAVQNEIHPGSKQSKEWQAIEKKYLKDKGIVQDHPSIKEFNLGELLIIKNWIYYAHVMGDQSARNKYQYADQNNPILKEMVEAKNKANIFIH